MNSQILNFFWWDYDGRIPKIEYLMNSNNLTVINSMKKHFKNVLICFHFLESLVKQYEVK